MLAQGRSKRMLVWISGHSSPMFVSDSQWLTVDPPALVDYKSRYSHVCIKVDNWSKYAYSSE